MEINYYYYLLFVNLISKINQHCHFISSKRRQLVRSSTDSSPNIWNVKNNLKKTKTTSLPENETFHDQQNFNGNNLQKFQTQILINVFSQINIQ